MQRHLWGLRLALMGSATSFACTTATRSPDAVAAPSEPVRTSETKPTSARMLLQEGKSLLARGKAAAAEDQLRQALDSARRVRPTDAALLVTTLTELARALVRLGRNDDARSLLTEALSLVTRSHDHDELVFRLQMVLAASFSSEQRPELAAAPLAEAAGIAARHQPEWSEQLVDATLAWAAALHGAGRGQEAIPILERARETVARGPASHRQAILLDRALIAGYLATGQPQQADQLLARHRAVARVIRRDSGSSDLPLHDAFGLAKPSENQSPPAAPPDAASPPRYSPRHDVADAGKQVAAMRPDFRRCYQQTLAVAPDVAGSVWLTLSIVADGRVSEARAAAFTLPPHFLDCLLARCLATRFSAPQGGSAVIAVPLTFAKQQAEG